MIEFLKWLYTARKEDPAYFWALVLCGALTIEFDVIYLLSLLSC